MAKKKKSGGTNKSQAIRDYMAANPSAKPRDVVTAMNSKGIKVSAQFVSTVKSTSKKKAPSKRRGRPAGSTNKAARTTKKPAARRGRPSSDSVSVDSLLKLKRVVEDLGSIDEAKAALDTLEKLAR